VDEKYVVFKIGDCDEVRPGMMCYISGEELKDAVVIRTQDVFAAAGLSAYAHSIRAFATVAWMTNDPSPAIYHRLIEIADYFDSVAQEAEDRLGRGECKVPD
jgi:hypothetical protein